MKLNACNDVESVPGLRRYFLVRASGLPMNLVDALRAPNAVRYISAMVTCEDDIARSRHVIGELLYAAIGTIQDRRQRNRVVQLRRDVFNGRRMQCDAALLSDLADPCVGRAFEELDRAVAAREAFVNELRAAFAHDVAASRRALQEVLTDEDFRRGVLVSSPTLARNLDKYRRGDVNDFDSRQEQIERGLLRYFTRTAMKATPFATLCGILPGYFCEATPSGEAEYVGNPHVKRPFARINKSLYEVLWLHLKARANVRRQLAVELNPTLTVTADALSFLTAVGSREAFQRVAREPALDHVLDECRAQTQKSLGALAVALAANDAIDADVGEVVEYLEHMVSIGLLRFRSGVAEQDADWDLAFGNLLAEIDDEHARGIHELLQYMRDALATYAGASAAQRQPIAEQILGRMRETMASLDVRGIIKNDLPFYEDAAAEAELVVPMVPRLQETLQRVAELLQAILPTSAAGDEQATMRQFFDTNYTKATNAVPLLQFYEDYYREHFKAHLEHERAANAAGGAKQSDYDLGNPFGLEIVKRRRAAVAALQSRLLETWRDHPEAVELAVRSDDVTAPLEQLPALPLRDRSVATFCQLDMPGDGRPPRVIMPNANVQIGRGRFFSRFLYLLPAEFLAEVYADNNASPSSECRAEICADGQFNANLHPPLLRYEIAYPTSDGARTRDECQLLCSDLSVQRDPDSPHALRLVLPDLQTTVVPFDLGFQNPRLRPPLFNLLARFTQLGATGLPIPEALTAPTSEAKREMGRNPKILYRPRFVYENAVVLSRRRWAVPSSLFPRREPTERDSEYFARLFRWRASVGIPEQVYVRVSPQKTRSRSDSLSGAAERQATAPDRSKPSVDSKSANETNNAEVAKTTPLRTERYSRDWMKPQYIDFASPLLVKLLAQIPAALPAFTLYFEERLPSADGLPSANGHQFANEVILQFDFRAALTTTWKAGVPEMAVNTCCL